MAFSTIRRATEDDYVRLNEAWARFYARIEAENGGDMTGTGMNLELVGDIMPIYNVNWESNSRIRGRWERIAHRALRLPPQQDIAHPVGICSGYVGYYGW